VSAFHDVYVAVAGGAWAPEPDDRAFADPAGGLAYVADASGPTYGGYHAPFGIDPGLEALVAAHCAGAGVEGALRAADRTMWDLHLAHDKAFKAALTYNSDRLAAGIHAANAVRPARWQHIKSFAHFGGSLTLCALSDPNTVTIGQIGACRAYRIRRGVLELLVPDHTLGTVMKGKELDSFQRGIVTRGLGFTDALQADVRSFATEPGDSYALCTDGVWMTNEPALARLRTAEDAKRLVNECAQSRGDDAALVVLHV
jgi:serine/threonine protein phosphatase PrpC